jgi:hypothetical protein
MNAENDTARRICKMFEVLPRNSTLDAEQNYEKLMQD